MTDLEIIMGCLDGSIQWEGVGPKPWWGPLARVERTLAVVDRLLAQDDVVTIKDTKWSATRIISIPAFRRSINEARRDAA